MALLFSEDIKRQIIDELSATSQDLHVISAYCKTDAVRFIEENIKKNIQNKKLMVRFRLDDVMSGATDLNVYDYCKRNNWELYIRFDLHAKTYVFDRIRGIVGSSNLTNRGIGLAQDPNYEIAQLSSVTHEEMRKIDSLFENAILMTDGLYFRMKQCLENQVDKPKAHTYQWDPDILGLFIPNVKVLFVHELPNCFSLSNLSSDSLDFLGLSFGWDIDSIRKAFLTSNAYLWLKQTLKKSSTHEMYYGALSSALHGAIINDPKPYRKEIKELQSNLLNWIIELDIDEISIERPNHSQLIRLNEVVAIAN